MNDTGWENKSREKTDECQRMGERVSRGDGARKAGRVQIILPLGRGIEGVMMFGVTSGICVCDGKEDEEAEAPH